MSSGQDRRKNKGAVKKSAWTAEEDMQLVNYINRFGIWNWTQMPRFAGLSRSGKSCRLRWMNYLDPKIRHGNYTQEEDEIIISMRQTMGAGWSAIAKQLPGRTDNEIKNRWHTHLKKRLQNNPIEAETSTTSTIEAETSTTSTIEAETSTTSNSTDYSLNYITHSRSASQPELANDEIPILPSDMSNEFLGSDTSSDTSLFESYYKEMTDVELLINLDSSETVEGPLKNFRKEQISLENDFMEDDHLATNYGQYNSDLLSMPQNCYEEPMNLYNCSNNVDFWFNLLTVSMDLDEKRGVYC